MKTHQPITIIALSCLLMLTLACENKAVRSVTGVEGRSSGDGSHEVAGHQDEKAFFGEPVVQVAEESLGEDGWAAAALSRDDFSANKEGAGEGAEEGAGLAGEADKTGSESSSDLFASKSKAAREPSSSGSEAPSSTRTPQASAGDQLAASGPASSGPASSGPASSGPASSGPASSGTSADHDDGRKKNAPALQDLRDIFFAYDSWQLSKRSHRILESNAKWLKAHPHARITIEGHCDQRGTQAYNHVLGQRRAETTQWYLSQLGVPSHQMAVVSFGKDQPLCYVFSRACFQSNRRAHFSMEVNTVSLN